MQITQTDSIATLLREMADGTETIFDIAEELEAGTTTKRIAFQRRQLQPEPSPEPRRFESPARNHTFHSLDSLSEFLTQYGTENSILFVDAPALSCGLIIDAKAERGIETCDVHLQVHPAFAHWEGFLSRDVPIKMFAEFLMSRRRDVVQPDGLELAHTFAQVKASTKITSEVGTGKNAINGVMCEVNIAGKLNQTPVDLPDSIEIEIPLFIGSEVQRLTIDLLVTTRGTNEVVVIATCSDLVERRLKALDSAIIELREEHSDLIICYGQLSFAPWRYQKEAITTI